jgi:NAD(P) transhydrogenase subunit alpha
LGITKEVLPLECRVATTPDVVRKLIKKGYTVHVESGAGVRSQISDEQFKEAGAEVLATAEDVWAKSDIMVKVHPPAEHPSGGHERNWLRADQMLITNIFPGSNKQLVSELTESKATVFALDCVPRITRAQKMDVRSSMDNIAGYRAVIEAANAYGGFFGGQMTAAGKSAPAKVLIIGAGVAGLAAIGAARGLGAIVRAFDVRPAVKEQVQSMGADFLEVEIDESGDGGGGYAKKMSDQYHEAQMALFLKYAAETDIVISTANIPGRKAPLLWEKQHLEAMKAGSVVVDLAAERGGNCEVTEAQKCVEYNGVKVLGFTDLNSRMSSVSSKFFAMNIFHMISEFGELERNENRFVLDLENEVIRGSVVLDGGDMLWPPPRVEPPPAPPKPEPEEEVIVSEKEDKAKTGGFPWAAALVAFVFGVIGLQADSAFVQHFSVFVLSCFIGWQVIWNVSHSLHTPLMSVTNAISGIIIVGGMLQLGGFDTSTGDLAAILGVVAILFAAINIAGGFLVTKRMLAMFRRD